MIPVRYIGHRLRSHPQRCPTAKVVNDAEGGSPTYDALVSKSNHKFVDFLKGASQTIAVATDISQLQCSHSGDFFL